jgi:alginate O-acetyltransferase complex protein AlgI
VLFNSIAYAAFLAFVVVLNGRLRHRQQNVFLLVASYAFYATWDWRFLALLVISTAIGYSSGLALNAAEDEARRRSILAGRVALNLGMLGVFKYAGFFVDSFEDLAHAVGLSIASPTFHIILPVAISYYTFEEISYAVDIYRRQIEPCRDPVAYGLFVAFFPKLVAGPILRPRELLPQIERPRTRLDADSAWSGLGLLGWGLVKKVVIADSLAKYVDQIYAEPSRMSWFSLVVGTLCFAGQIYADFSGYTDMARGAARLLRFELPLNFRQPYLSNSLTAFWRTWHISLSTWLRDYLYVPLGGNRRGPRRTMINLMTVMVLGGLWHGAGWTFLIWGAIHGGGLALERRNRGDNSDDLPRLKDLPAILATFTAVCVAWVFFRAPDLGSAVEILTRIITLRPGVNVTDAAIWLGGGAIVIAATDIYSRRAEVHRRRLDSKVKGALAGIATGAVLVTSGGTPVPFIYFQF